jgi:Coenzyme PQQ synthesis protein D (PqqD)
MTALRRPNRTDGYKLEALDDELLLYHPAQARAIYMNETATVIWGLCDGRTVEEIAEVLAGAFPDAPGSLPEDIRATIEQLVEFGAVREFQES